MGNYLRQSQQQAKKWYKGNAHVDLSCGSELQLDTPSEPLIKDFDQYDCDEDDMIESVYNEKELLQDNNIEKGYVGWLIIATTKLASFVNKNHSIKKQIGGIPKPVDTRWNSHFDLMMLLLKQKVQINFFYKKS